MTDVNDALAVRCPVCESKPYQPCTTPTDTGQRYVSWVHMKRQDLWETHSALKGTAMITTGRSNRYEVAGQLAQENGDHVSAAWAADQQKKETEMTIATPCPQCGGPITADGYHLMGVPCSPTANRAAQSRTIRLTATKVKGKGWVATCVKCNQEIVAKSLDRAQTDYAVHLTMNCDDPATLDAFEQQIAANVGSALEPDACPKCAGSGADPAWYSGTYPCSRCKGTGKVTP